MNHWKLENLVKNSRVKILVAALFLGTIGLLLMCLVFQAP